jgi:V8-like Glu-specific endopeptidase
MNCRSSLIFVCIGCLWLSIAGCQSSKQNETASKSQESQDIYSVLNKYTDQQLKAFISSRRNKSLHDETPADVGQYSDRQIGEFIVYRQKSLYGPDRRKEFYEIQDPIQLAVVNSVGALVDSDHFLESPSSYDLSGDSLGNDKKLNLCSGAHYEMEPEISYCTAFVVGPDMIATAGHCVPRILDHIRLVFGYRAIRPHEDTQIVKEIPKSQVYKITDVVKCVDNEPLKQNDKCQGDGLGGRTLDYALLRVDRKIRDHLPLPLDITNGVAEKDELYVVGYPLGLPMKLADQGLVRSVSNVGYFASNLDTFAGNSGSPVLRAGTLTVEGILVRGDNDFWLQGSCQVALVCPRDKDCKNDGEDSTLLKSVADVFDISRISSADGETHEPISKIYSSGTVMSGVGPEFSPEYKVVSDPTPAGYKIANFSAALSGTRVCNAWSTCQTTIEGNRVVFRFKIQGDVQRIGYDLPFGQHILTNISAKPVSSEGHLIVNYVWVGTN